MFGGKNTVFLNRGVGPPGTSSSRRALSYGHPPLDLQHLEGSAEFS